MDLLPTENLLDVLKFLTYFDSCNIRKTTRKLAAIVERYKHLLPLCKFHKIEILPDTKVLVSTLRKTRDIAEDFQALFDDPIDEIYQIELSEAQEEKWENALEKYIPVYAYPEKPESILEIAEKNEIDSFFIFITKNEGELRSLSLELPIYPANMDDLKFTYFWLEQLSLAHFHYFDCTNAFFNPEMVKILFFDRPLPNGGQLHFHMYSYRTFFKVGGLDELFNARAIQFALNNLVTDCVIFRVRAYYEGVLDFLLAGGDRIPKIIFPHGPDRSTVELQNLLIFHAECSANPTKIIPQIDFHNVNDLEWPQMRKAIVTEKGVADDLDFIKYRLANVHNQDVEFTIEIGHLAEAKEFKRFSIQRVMGNKNENNENIQKEEKDGSNQPKK